MKNLFFAGWLALLCMAAPSAWAALDVHDDIKIDYVTTGANNVDGTAIVFPNGGGTVWVTLYEDDRAVGELEAQQHDGTWVGTETTLIDTFYSFSAQTSVSFSAGTRYDIEEMQIRTLQAAKVLRLPPFIAKTYLAQARGFSRSELAQALIRLHKTDIAIKTGTPIRESLEGFLLWLGQPGQ